MQLSNNRAVFPLLPAWFYVGSFIISEIWLFWFANYSMQMEEKEKNNKRKKKANGRPYKIILMVMATIMT